MKVFFLAALLAVSVFGEVDINHATKKELVTLKGVGEKKAEAIIAYRNTHCFKSVEELQQVKGIGKSIVEKNKLELKAGECH